MFLRQAFHNVHSFSANQLSGLSDLLCPELIEQCLKETGIAIIRKRLGHEPVEAVFNKTQQLWHEKPPHPDWHGLTLHTVDGVAPDNDAHFGRTANKTTISDYPQVRMVCLLLNL